MNLVGFFRSDNGFRVGLAAVLLAYLLLCTSAYSPALFGAYHDDTLYFSAGKAIADGRGLVMPNVPEEPPLTKYPPLFPWILSLVWTVAPEFPANVGWAWALNLVFGCCMLAAAAGMLRGLGCGRPETLLLTAVFAVHPAAIEWSNILISDVLFAALVLAAAAFGDAAIRRRRESARSSWLLWGLAVGLAWLAVFTRSAGVAVAAGLTLFALINKRWSAAALAATAGMPVAAQLVSAVINQAGPLTPNVDGYQQTLLFYTSYAGFWKLCVPDWATFSAQVSFVFLETLKHPAVACFLLPAEFMAPKFVQAAAFVVSMAILNGVAGRARRRGVAAVHLIAVAYLPIVLLWNYPLMSRFWLPFLPLFLSGASFETLRIGKQLAAELRAGKSKDQRVAAAVLGVLGALLLSYGLYGYAQKTPNTLSTVVRSREAILPSKIEAWRWLEENAPDSARVVAYEDGLTYLYAGVQGMRPMSFSTAAFFNQDETILDRDLDRIGDTAQRIGAGYWMTSVHDFWLENAGEKARDAENELLADAPVVFESSDGRVRIFELPPSRLASK